MYREGSSSIPGIRARSMMHRPSKQEKMLRLCLYTEVGTAVLVPVNADEPSRGEFSQVSSVKSLSVRRLPVRLSLPSSPSTLSLVLVRPLPPSLSLSPSVPPIPAVPPPFLSFSVSFCAGFSQYAVACNRYEARVYRYTRPATCIPIHIHTFTYLES